MTIKTYLGFDVGTKRTGVAIANSLTAKANGIDTVIHNKEAKQTGKILRALSISISQISLLCDFHLMKRIKNKK